MDKNNSACKAPYCLGDLVDLARYPISDPDSIESQAFVAECRQQFEQSGALNLPGFIKPDVVTQLVSEVERSKSLGHRMVGEFTPYSDDLSEEDNLNLPEGHPRRYRLPASHRFLAGDLVPAQSAIKQIYSASEIIDFVAVVLGRENLFAVPDPLGCINKLVYERGDSNGWHFDTNEFVVSIMLQPAAEGGEYQYIPNLRSPENENHEGVIYRMRNPDCPDGVKTVDLSTGSLFLFKGRYTLHRVTRILGDSDRIVAILNYHGQPDHKISEGSKLAMYGRAA